MHIDKDICDLLVMGIKKRDVRCELVTRKSATQRTAVFLSCKEMLTVSGLRQSIIVIFCIRDSKQENALVHKAFTGNGYTVLGRSFVTPCGFFVYGCNKICPFALSPKLIT